MKVMYFLRALFVFVLNFALSQSLVYGSDFQSPHVMGLGGAGHATPILNDSIYLSPSFTSFNRYRALAANYLWHYSDPINSTDSQYKGQMYNVSILDGNPESLFQAGVGFTKRGDASFIHIGASKSIIGRLGVGIGSKFIFPSGTLSRYFDGTLSFSGLATAWLQASFNVDNLFESAAQLGYFREYTLGTRFSIGEIVALYIDPHWVPTNTDSNKFGYEAGLEFTILTDFYLRLGKFGNSVVPFQGIRADGFGAGVGWMGPKLSIDYGLSRPVSPIAAIAHSFGLSVFF